MRSEKLAIAEAAVTSKGQITVPSAVRRLLHLASGDRLRFLRSKDGSILIEARKRRSIVDVARQNRLIAKRPLQNLEAEVDAAVGEAMAEREARVRRHSGR
jgi:AbrB family looped-hinge helix DNA binding protein